MTDNAMPQAIKDEFIKRDINPDFLIYYVFGDMDQKGEYCDSWVAFDSGAIYILTGFEKVKRTKGARKLVTAFDALGFAKIALKDIDSLKVERYISTARLIYEKDAKQYEIIYISIGYANFFEGFARVVNAHIKGEDYDLSAIESQKKLLCPKCGTRYPEPERKVCPKCLNKISITVRLWQYFRKYKRQIAVILVCILLSSLFNILSPYVGTKLFYDEVLASGGRYFGMVAGVILLFAAVKLLGLGLGILYGRVVAYISPKIIYDVRVDIFTSMQKLSMGFYSSKQTGSLMNRVHHDADSIYWFVVDGVPYVIVNALTLIGIMVMMLLLDWKLTLTYVVSIPLLSLTFSILWRYYGRYHHNRWVRNSRLTSLLSDAINGRRVIKAFSKEKDVQRRFDGYSHDLYDAELRLVNMDAYANVFLSACIIIAQVIVICLGVLMVYNGRLPIGSLIAFTVYMGMVVGPIEFFTYVSNWWSRCVDAAQRVFEIIDSEPEIVESENAVAMPEMKGEIRVENASFEYEPGRPVVKNISMSVQPGQMLGIVGKTGAGKSTIVNLMARLYYIKSGAISIDGVNIKDIRIADLRKNIGIVSQEIYLFMGTIADNIRYARPTATMEEVIAAAKAASAHDFIIKLSDGYDTWVGASGQDLSGGEKQRISIARAIIQNPKILILDEATASMDTETERNIQQSLSRLQKGRTTIAIAHRLSTLRDADVLAVIDDGKVVEFGTFEELIMKKGEYYKLYKLQMEALKFIGIGE